MDIKKLDDQVSVSEHIVCDAMSPLARSGVQVVVCNCPEGESEAHPSYVEMEQAALEAGLKFLAIPFTRGRMTREHCETFRGVLQGGEKIHAFCRTGNRSSQLWAGARIMMGADKKQLHSQASAAGFDIGAVLLTVEA
ncbi:TIGR01244 family sulfur transferase [Microbulbifer sp. OS29]|uniref:TIGR01244 family sulfur transferase n=1 Tax=Microbulbifer okhotskensis TaxID=2926617 RepID=A0A9X2ES93_9GAMM|nr:TIGR01244 family sulfur transferase [Microbulbifer okhotskensis]MCO1336470.1 TIGR01244 family sulfur transferase [Microbulbifer okhotskensis]